MNALGNKILARSIMTVAFLAAVFESPLTWAPYGYDPAAHRDDKPGNVYFGSAKDSNADYVSGATIILETKKLEIVTVTDPTGRFRVELPVDVLPSAVTPHCSLKGYKLGEVVTRLPPGGEPSPVEINCVLGK